MAGENQLPSKKIATRGSMYSTKTLKYFQKKTEEWNALSIILKQVYDNGR